MNLSIGAQRGAAVDAGLRLLEGRRIGWFRLSGGKHHGAIGPPEGEIIERLVKAACDAGVPVVGVLDTSGAEVGAGVASLHAWGRVARALTHASGVVPVVLAVVGPCVSGPALLLGLADVVVMTSNAFAYVSGPEAFERFAGIAVSHADLGGAAVHRARSGVASLVVDDEEAAVWAIEDVLNYLPDNNLTEPPVMGSVEPLDPRPAQRVPALSTASYDMRSLIADVVDAGTLLELRAGFAPNLITALARMGGRPVGVIANQPQQLAGTIDITCSQKGARFVLWCDAFNLPIVTFVDTPGFQPGKDLEWRGMIRKGAQLAHAYAVATVPRVSVVVRKAYGGAYIVMDSKTMGSDCCVAWPDAEIAVMGAEGAVQILEGRRLAAVDDEDERGRRRAELEDTYRARYMTAGIAAERGYLDDVIAPGDTRRVILDALAALAAKREQLPQRRHANIPL